MIIVCRRLVSNVEDAEELMVDGFLRFLAKLDLFTFTNEASFYRWLEKIMVNVCLEYLRSKTNFSIVSVEAAEDVTIPEEAHARLTSVELFRLVEQMPKGYRTVFDLYATHNMSHNEIAESLGITVSASKTQYLKSKKYLQKKLITLNENYAARK